MQVTEQRCAHQNTASDRADSKFYRLFLIHIPDKPRTLILEYYFRATYDYGF